MRPIKAGFLFGRHEAEDIDSTSSNGSSEDIDIGRPTAGLDPKERIRIRNLISEISFNKIVIIATHVVQDIEYIAKEVMLLRNGELVAKDTPSALLSTVARRF